MFTQKLILSYSSKIIMQFIQIAASIIVARIAGPSTGLWTHTSAKMCYFGIPLKEKNFKYRPTKAIKIEDNVYIGGNCTIYPGTTIHNHSIISPNSAVTKDVPSYTLVGGVPAHFIKRINY